MAVLESYFKSSEYICELRKRPFGNYLDQFSSELTRLGYNRKTGRRMLWKIGQFNKYALRARLKGLSQINKKLINNFIKKTSRSKFMTWEIRWAINHFLKYLIKHHLIKNSPVKRSSDSFDKLILRYDAHLLNVRGLSLWTRESYLRGARRMINWLKNKRPPKQLKELSGVDVLKFITKHIGINSSPSWRHHICGETRAFLRYLQWEGIIKANLAGIVPSVASKRLGTIPRHLEWSQVRQLIASVKTDSPVGKRDKAILLLLALQGFRNQEVRKLKLTDIDWQNGRIHLVKTKSYRERILPLTQEAGDALAEYILHGRPQVKSPYVFLKHMTPVGAISSTHGVGDVVEKHLKRAGIKSPSYGAYVLRHSLATHMINRQVPVKSIADVLGHVSIDTTAIYTKVNHEQLAKVARVFPGGGL